jgi:hypothetical protein
VQDGERTRLVYRVRISAPPLGRVLMLALFEPADFIQSRKMLTGMKRRAETHDIARLAPAHEPGGGGSARAQRRGAHDAGRRQGTMRPVVVEAEVDISRPPEQVFDYCCDPGHEPEWNPMMKSSKKITDGPVGVGARYATEFVKGPPMVMERVGYERPSAWSWLAAHRL